MSIKIDFKNKISKEHLASNLSQKLKKKINKVFFEINNDILDQNKTLNVLNKEYKFNFKIKDLQKFKKIKTIVLIGMGGSILGSKAIYYFLRKKIKKNFIFFDNLEENKLVNFKKRKDLSKILFLIISKSGKTIETLSNSIFLNIIKKNSKNIIIISEKKNNTLYNLSKKFNLFYIEHKKNVGGRYSVLSEVGLVPGVLMELNVLKLRSDSKEFLKGKYKNFLKDSSIKLANIMASNKINNLIFLNYSSELEQFLYWCQQLIAESLGKDKKGLLPMISNVPKDHHSLLQLYLDGPRDKLFYFFSLEPKVKNKINFSSIEKAKKILNKKNLHSIKDAQRKALIKTLVKKNIPFREFKIKSLNEETIGKLFTYFILETIAVGKLLNLNPFDQPAVEQVKIYTKKLLS